MSTAVHLAVLDDEADITTLLARYLAGHGFRVSQLHDGPALMALMAEDPADLVLLDLGLPGEDGFSIARQLRERWRCGLVIVTGRGDPGDKVVGLEVGADDYVTKPFDLRELVARVKAVLRRTQELQERLGPASQPAALTSDTAAETLCFEGWRLNTASRTLLHPRGHEVFLTSGEFELLCVFARRPGRVLSRDVLMTHTRGREAGPFDRTVDVQVGRLRGKMESDRESPQIIKSVRGAGYIFVPAVSRG
ncbi:MAG: DNA-binding response regulator [Variovorax paradoxus]|nr:MAG: DNA-binding response regulator [Variovorax paradoxus]PZQ04457.1 MAG: DNA-binding response regulator [Variovorax paradoxus]